MSVGLLRWVDGDDDEEDFVVVDVVVVVLVPVESGSAICQITQ